MAGGLIIALGLDLQPDGTYVESKEPICGGELGTGIHRGKIILRTNEDLAPKLGVGAKMFDIKEETLSTIEPFIKELDFSTSERVDNISKSLEESNFDVIRDEIHTIKGSSLTYKVVFLSNLAKEIDFMFKDGKPNEEIAEKIPLLIQEFEKAKKFIQENCS